MLAHGLPLFLILSLHTITLFHIPGFILFVHILPSGAVLMNVGNETKQCSCVVRDSLCPGVIYSRVVAVNFCGGNVWEMSQQQDWSLTGCANQL